MDGATKNILIFDFNSSRFVKKTIPRLEESGILCGYHCERCGGTAFLTSLFVENHKNSPVLSSDNSSYAVDESIGLTLLRSRKAEHKPYTLPTVGLQDEHRKTAPLQSSRPSNEPFTLAPVRDDVRYGELSLDLHYPKDALGTVTVNPKPVVNQSSTKNTRRDTASELGVFSLLNTAEFIETGFRAGDNTANPVFSSTATEETALKIANNLDKGLKGDSGVSNMISDTKDNQADALFSPLKKPDSIVGDVNNRKGLYGSKKRKTFKPVKRGVSKCEEKSLKPSSSAGANSSSSTEAEVKNTVFFSPQVFSPKLPKNTEHEVESAKAGAINQRGFEDSYQIVKFTPRALKRFFQMTESLSDLRGSLKRLKPSRVSVKRLKLSEDGTTVHYTKSDKKVSAGVENYSVTLTTKDIKLIKESPQVKDIK